MRSMISGPDQLAVGPRFQHRLAASCIRHCSPLLTLNEADFAYFGELDGLVLLTS